MDNTIYLVSNPDDTHNKSINDESNKSTRSTSITENPTEYSDEVKCIQYNDHCLQQQLQMFNSNVNLLYQQSEQINNYNYELGQLEYKKGILESQISEYEEYIESLKSSVESYQNHLNYMSSMLYSISNLSDNQQELSNILLALYNQKNN
jgi:hypothetical protein